MRSIELYLSVLLLLIPGPLLADAFECVVGAEVEASLGAGVTLRTCSWEKQPGLLLRVGPLELKKNGIVILKTQTDENGRLHGQFSSWNDAGQLTESGHYSRGRKDGAWLVTDKNGRSETVHYKQGERVTP